MRASRTGGSVSPSTTRLRTVPIPSTVSFHHVPGAQRRRVGLPVAAPRARPGSRRCRRCRSRARPARTWAPREAYAMSSSNGHPLLPTLIAGTRRVAMIQGLLAARLGLGPGSGIRLLDCPFGAVPVQEALRWHPVHTHDAGHVWLREMASAVSARIGLVPSGTSCSRPRRGEQTQGSPRPRASRPANLGLSGAPASRPPRRAGEGAWARGRRRAHQGLAGGRHRRTGRRWRACPARSGEARGW